MALEFELSSTLSSLVGNPGQIFKSEVYNNILPEDRFESGLSQYIVRLTSNDMPNSPVRGLLTENFSINVDAEWDALDIIGGLTSHPFLSGVYKIGSLISEASGIANVTNTGISTRKVYNKSGYLEIELKFRVVDWRGTGEPVKSAFLLSSMCLPKNSKNYTAKESIAEAAKLVPTTIGNTLALISSAMGHSPEETEKLKTAIGTDYDKFKNWLYGKVAPLEGVLTKIAPMVQPLIALVKDPQFLVLASAPSTITVEIGNYFHHNDMIVKNVKCDFSKQACSAGPLFVDFNMSVSSRQAILMGVTGATTEQDLGLMVGGKKRVEYQNRASAFVGPVQPFIEE